jgi:hypothetical protein
MNDTDITERRRQLADTIRQHGPEHFNIDHMYTVNGEQRNCLTPNVRDTINRGGNWTACLIGHEELLWARRTVSTTTGVNITHVIDPIMWHHIEVDGWNMGDAIADRRFNGQDARVAEWATVLDLLDHLVKHDEQ